MKKIVIVLCILLKQTMYAGTGSVCEEQVLYAVQQLVLIDSANTRLKLSGSVLETFTIDANSKIEVLSIESTDYLSAFYTKELLNGAAIRLADTVQGRTYVVEIHFANGRIQKVLYAKHKRIITFAIIKLSCIKK
jgi:hypothetical protein